MEIQELLRKDPEDLDTLLQVAELVREAVEEKREEEISGLLRFAAEHGYHEALYWAAGILDECCARGAETLCGLECALGRTIAEYDTFMSRLGVDLNAFENEVQPVRDENGEIQAFFNVIRYKTGFDHIELVTSENFDARDNDYIQYLLVCR